jgi:hypothetical protein
MHDRVDLLLEKDRILERTKALFIASHRKDWPAVIDCLTEQVRFDMTSMTGEPPALVPAVEIASRWEKGLADIAAVHHQIGNELVTIDGGKAHVFCYGIALHFSPLAKNGTTRRFVGSYDLDLVKQDEDWKIREFAFHLKFIDGNADLT